VRRVTADTNVIVSALMFGGKPLAILDLAQAGDVELALSDAIMNEVLRILHDKFYRSPAQIEEIRSHLRAITTAVEPSEKLDVVKSDPDDNKILECAVAAGSEMVITGDDDLLRIGNFQGIKIRKPADFLAGIHARTR
jgi:uncharacterized protein